MTKLHGPEEDDFGAQLAGAQKVRQVIATFFVGFYILGGDKKLTGDLTNPVRLDDICMCPGFDPCMSF